MAGAGGAGDGPRTGAVRPFHRFSLFNRFNLSNLSNLSHWKAGEWRTAAWLGGLLVAGLVLLMARPATAPVVGGTVSPPAGRGGGGKPLVTTGSSDPLRAQEQSMDRELEASLERIAGAGQVTVRVDLASGAVTHFAANTQDTDSVTRQGSPGGSSQTTTQQNRSRQLLVGSGGGPTVQSVQAPQVRGVLVVATGASALTVRTELAAAVRAATGAPLYRIAVLPAAAETG